MTTTEQSERGFDLVTTDDSGPSPRPVKVHGWQYLSGPGIWFLVQAGTRDGVGVTLAPADAISVGLELVRLGEQAQAEGPWR